MKVEKKMTNAEKLAKDTKTLTAILMTYHNIGDCEGCVFEHKCLNIGCLNMNFDWKEWLEQEAEEDGRS